MLFATGRCGEPFKIFGATVFTWAAVEEALFKLGILIYSGLFWAIDVLYQLFVAVGSARIFREETLSSFSQRVYIVLGIVMLFFITYQIFQMMITPDKLTGGGEGSGKDVVLKFVTTIMLLISVSFIFNVAYQVQGFILSEDVMGKIFFGNIDGTSSSATVEKPGIYEGGKTMGTSIFKAFFYPKYIKNPNYVNDFEIEIFKKGSKSETYKHTYQEVIDLVKVSGPWFLSDISCKHLIEGDPNEQIDFPWVLLTAAGIFAVWVLLSYTLALGVRVAELGFLQLIAPIPISMRIMPKQKATFDKWLKMTLSKFAEIFIRVAIVYFGVFIITLVGELNLGDMWEDIADKPSLVIQVLATGIVIFGIFQFMQDAPKLFEKLGLSTGGGDYGLNLKKRYNDNKLFSSAVKTGIKGGKVAASSVAGGAMGAVRGAVRERPKVEGRNKFTRGLKHVGRGVTRTAAALGSGTAGMFRAGKNAMSDDTSFKQAVLNARDAAVQRKTESMENKKLKQERKDYIKSNALGAQDRKNRFQSFVGNVVPEERQVGVGQTIKAANDIQSELSKLQAFTNDSVYQELKNKTRMAQIQAETLMAKKAEADIELKSPRLNKELETLGSAANVIQSAKATRLEADNAVSESATNLQSIQQSIASTKAKTEELKDASASISNKYDRMINAESDASKQAAFETIKQTELARLSTELELNEKSLTTLEGKESALQKIHAGNIESQTKAVAMENRAIAEVNNSVQGFTNSNGQQITISNLTQEIQSRESEKQSYKSVETQVVQAQQEVAVLENQTKAQGKKLALESKPEIEAALEKISKGASIGDKDLAEKILPLFANVTKDEKGNITSAVNKTAEEVFEDINSLASTTNKVVADKLKKAEETQKALDRAPKADKNSSKDGK